MKGVSHPLAWVFAELKRMICIIYVGEIRLRIVKRRREKGLIERILSLYQSTMLTMLRNYSQFTIWWSAEKIAQKKIWNPWQKVDFTQLIPDINPIRGG